MSPGQPDAGALHLVVSVTPGPGRQLVGRARDERLRGRDCSAGRGPDVVLGIPWRIDRRPRFTPDLPVAGAAIVYITADEPPLAVRVPLPEVALELTVAPARLSLSLAIRPPAQPKRPSSSPSTISKASD
jgi:hypothetical protein